MLLFELDLVFFVIVSRQLATISNNSDNGPFFHTYGVLAVSVFLNGIHAPPKLLLQSSNKILRMASQAENIKHLILETL